MVYVLCIAVQDDSNYRSMLNYCVDSFDDVLDCLAAAYCDYTVISFSLIRKFAEED